MASFVDALMVARLDAAHRGGATREAWRVVGPVLLSVRFLAPNLHCKRQLVKHCSPAGVLYWLVMRTAPVACAYLGSLVCMPACSLATLCLLMAEKALNDVFFLTDVGACKYAALLVRSIIGVHVSAGFPYFIGIMAALCRRQSIFLSLGLAADCITRSLV